MENNIEYYLKLPYTRELIPEPEGGWFVSIKELPGCMSQGDSAEEALIMIEDAMRGWLEAEINKGSVIPEPRLDEDYSGKFVVRVAKSMHRKLVDAADIDGVSLNQWINYALAEAIGDSSQSKAVNSNAINSWQGLADGVYNLLKDVGLEIKNDVSDEKNFSTWLIQNVLDSYSDCENQSYDQAFSKSKALVMLLLKYRRSSPLLDCIYQLALNHTRLLNQVCSLGEDIQFERQINQEINRVLTSKTRRTSQARNMDMVELDLEQVKEQIEAYNFG